MTQDEIIRIAREAHRELVTKDYPGHLGQLDFWTTRLLERFAALVAAHEREACAKVCEEVNTANKGFPLNAKTYAAAIRARGEK